MNSPETIPPIKNDISNKEREEIYRKAVAAINGAFNKVAKLLPKENVIIRKYVANLLRLCEEQRQALEIAKEKIDTMSKKEDMITP